MRVPTKATSKEPEELGTANETIPTAAGVLVISSYSFYGWHLKL